MGWFDEKIRQQQQSDADSLEESLLKLAGAVMGRRLAMDAQEDALGAKSAMEDILRFYGFRAAEVPPELKDVNDQIDYLIRPHGLMRREVHLERGWRKDAWGAMLGRRVDTGAVTSLIPGRMGGYTWFDETTGRRVRVTAANEANIEPDAVVFYAPFPRKKLGFAELARYVLSLFEPYDFTLVIISALAVTLTGLVGPFVNQILFSTVIETGSISLLASATMFLVLAMAAQLLLNTFQTFATRRLDTKLRFSVESATMLRILSLPANFFRQYASGDLTNRSEQVGELCSMLVNTVLSAGLTGVFSLIYIGQIFAYAPSLVAPSLTVLILTVLLTSGFTVWEMKLSKRRMEMASLESGMTYALISGVRKLKLAGSEKRAFARWARCYAAFGELTYGKPMLLRVSSVIIMGINLAGTVLMYYLAVRNHVSIADYYAFNAAFAMVSGAFNTLAGLAMSAAEIKPVLDICRPILETEPESSDGRRIVTRLKGGIEMSHVTFRYSETMPPVLNDISLKIRPGQYVAIVGKTGCGKSTLTRVLLGFEKPEKGAVYYDGQDLTTLELSSLRRKIGTVMQNGKLMQGDIYSNIVISAPWLTMDDAWEAAELAGLADDIREMPMGMHTILSEGLGGISGGQKQRLMIARAVAPKPKLLIFDEATSALDNLTQKRVSEALDKLKCTRIVIAHRLSTIRRCDRILVLDGGHIIEDGSYDELIAQNGFFAELVARQRLDAPQTA